MDHVKTDFYKILVILFKTAGVNKIPINDLLNIAENSLNERREKILIGRKDNTQVDTDEDLESKLTQSLIDENLRDFLLSENESAFFNMSRRLMEFQQIRNDLKAFSRSKPNAPRFKYHNNRGFSTENDITITDRKRDCYALMLGFDGWVHAKSLNFQPEFIQENDPVTFDTSHERLDKVDFENLSGLPSLLKSHNELVLTYTQQKIIFVKLDSLLKENKQLLNAQVESDLRSFLKSTFDQLVNTDELKNSSVFQKIELFLDGSLQHKKLHWSHRAWLATCMTISILESFDRDKYLVLIRLLRFETEPEVYERAVIGISISLISVYNDILHFQWALSQLDTFANSKRLEAGFYHFFKQLKSFFRYKNVKGSKHKFATSLGISHNHELFQPINSLEYFNSNFEVDEELKSSLDKLLFHLYDFKLIGLKKQREIILELFRAETSRELEELIVKWISVFDRWYEACREGLEKTENTIFSGYWSIRYKWVVLDFLESLQTSSRFDGNIQRLSHLIENMNPLITIDIARLFKSSEIHDLIALNYSAIQNLKPNFEGVNTLTVGRYLLNKAAKSKENKIIFEAIGLFLCAIKWNHGKKDSIREIAQCWRVLAARTLDKSYLIEAYNWLSRCYFLDKKDASNSYYIGLLLKYLWKNGNNDNYFFSAKEWLQRAISLDKSKEKYLNTLGDMMCDYADKKKLFIFYFGASQFYEKALLINEKDTTNLNNIAYCWIRIADLDSKPKLLHKALNKLLQAYSIDNKDTVTLKNLGICAQMIGGVGQNREERQRFNIMALMFFKEYLEITPQDSKVLKHMAISKFRLGDMQGAKELLLLVVKEPDSVERYETYMYLHLSSSYLGNQDDSFKYLKLLSETVPSTELYLKKFSKIMSDCNLQRSDKKYLRKILLKHFKEQKLNKKFLDGMLK